ncbi:MAG: hypothetical protein ABI321_04990 [Polyangia bacterium]
MRSWRGWSLIAAVAALLTTQTASAAQLVLYSIPSPHGISWKSPRALFASRLKNEFTLQKKPAHKLGHVAIELTSEEHGHFLTGMTDTGQVSYVKQLVKGGYGLELMQESVPGRLQTPAELKPDLQRRFASGRVNYLRFEITEKTAARVAEFIDTYHARGYDEHYGGTLRPRHGEGGGCSAFGTSCMAVAGVLDEQMTKAWREDVRLPKRLIGGPEAGKKVSPLKLLFSNLSSRWARPGEPSETLDIYDPGAIATWIRAEHDSLPAGGAIRHGMKMSAEKSGKAKGIFVDARNIPTPTEPIFQGAAAR